MNTDAISPKPLHSRGCDYCGGATSWRASDPPPQKCAHCGAPGKKVEAFVRTSTCDYDRHFM